MRSSRSPWRPDTASSIRRRMRTPRSATSSSRPRRGHHSTFAATPGRGLHRALGGWAGRDPCRAGAGGGLGRAPLSNTPPPFFYLLLNLWIRIFGPGDAALRLFSVWWAALSLPLLWLVGRHLG